MTDRDFQAEAQAAQVELDGLIEPMTVALDEWVDVLAPWVQGVWGDMVAKAIEDPDNAAQIEAMSDDALRALRTNVDETIAGAHAHLHKCLIDDAPERWPHSKPQASIDEFSTRSSFQTSPFEVGRVGESSVPPTAVRSQVQDAFSAIGAPFGDAGLKPPSYVRREGARWVTGYLPDWPEHVSEALERYAQLHVRMIELFRELGAIETARSQNSAKSRWDSLGA